VSNLLFVFGDEHRRQSVGCYGNPDVRTPALDRLAAEGVRCTRAYANMAVCTPSRGSLLTGCWPQCHRAIGNDLPIDPAAPSIARALNAAGFACAYAGKWHLGGVPRSRFVPPGPERLGFDAFWASWNCHHAYFQPKYFLDTPDPVVIEGRYEPVVQTDLALDWLRTHRAQAPAQPFCFFLSYGPPHSPYRPLPPGMEGAYDPDALHLRPNCADTPQARRDLADYYAHITALDAQLARLLDYLRGSGELDDTLVVYSSDHGTLLESHGHKYKQWPHEESIGIPLLMRFGERLPRGRTVDALIGVVDLAPTLLGLLGCPVPPAMQGADLSALVRGDAAAGSGPESLYLQEATAGDQARSQGMLPWRGLRTRRYTYARNLDGPWMLFDDEADPYQLRNLVDDPAARDIRDALDRDLQRWMASTGDVLEPVDALMARHGLSDLWTLREDHLHRPGNMSGSIGGL
jgi:arylsulfatase A-like enzyme